MTGSFIGTLDNDRSRTVVKVGDCVTVRLSEADYLRSGALSLVAEIRKLNDGRIVLGVDVKSGETLLLGWNNLAPSWTAGGLAGDPAPHEVTVLEDLCTALEALAVDEHDAAYDALAAGRLLLSSAAYQRARALRDAGSGEGIGEVRSLSRDGMRYTATFLPQVWVGDYAMEVEPEGPTSWDVTVELTAMPEDERERRICSSADNDYFRYSSGAPAWVESWSGPFEVIISEVRR